MFSRITVFLIVVMFTAPIAYAQLPARTPETDAEALRLMRNDKLDVILPGAMRDNDVDMWIHVTRDGDPDPMARFFGRTYTTVLFRKTLCRPQRFPLLGSTMRQCVMKRCPAPSTKWTTTGAGITS